MFEAVDSQLDLVALEQRALERWRREDLFAESLRRREGSPEWVFFEGPPTANGRPGIHHVWARLFKDIFPRFQTMRGHYVARKGGWDCHGLPVEVQVEKELGFSGKPQIEDYGIEAFNARCRSSVQRYVEDWQALTGRIGMWLDTANAYWTMSNQFIESVWWLFAQMWAKGDIYEGYKVVPYCGRCGTALSSHELGQPGAYRDITEPSVYVRFPVRDRDFDLVVWTTTPWTLPANVAAAVGPDIEYARVRDPEGGRDLVLASARVGAVLGGADGAGVEVVATLRADELVGLHYERPFDYVPIDDGANRVVAAEFVTVDDGSGIVHLAPAFGEIDREVAVVEDLPALNPVDANARFTDAMPTPHRGRFVKDADADLVKELGAARRLVAVVAHTHSYPHCWRCDTPLIYWAKPTWFARTSTHRAEMLRENELIRWHPDHIQHGRFGNWLEGNIDWALSRDRFWGTPIPVWRCLDCGHDTCVQSVEQLGALAVAGSPDVSGLDLHRPYVDDVFITCSECGGRSRRVEPVLDAWFDSGSMPAAQFHYPFENVELFERRFPADFICEAIDQTRGWFYSLLAVNTLVFDHAPYRDVVCLAHIVDEQGAKMSKSRGNVIDPWTVLDSRGAEALRWYMFSSGSPWTPKRVFVQAIDEATNRCLRTLWSTYSFFVMYANLDGWDPATDEAAPAQHVLDRWIRSRTERTVAAVTDALEDFDALAGAQAIDALVDDLSNWYVRRSRSRFWKASDDGAHETLHRCLSRVALVLAPYCPFLADEMWRNLARTDESVHLQDWPVVDTAALDDELEAEMALARAVTSLGRSARADAKIGIRQPLPRAIALLGREQLRSDVVTEIELELNVKRLEIVESLEGLLDYTVVPNFRTLGPRLGKLLPALKTALADTDGHAVREAFASGSPYVVHLDGTDVELHPSDVEVRARQHDDVTLAQEGALAVALDLTLDDALRAEGIARELVRSVNDARKARGFAIADRIQLVISTQGAVAAAARAHAESIASEVLAVDLAVRDIDDGASPEATVAGEPVELKLTLAG